MCKYQCQLYFQVVPFALFFNFQHQISRSPIFERDGFDIHSNVSISFTQVGMGIVVPLLCK